MAQVRFRCGLYFRESFVGALQLLRILPRRRSIENALRKLVVANREDKLLPELLNEVARYEEGDSQAEYFERVERYLPLNLGVFLGDGLILRG